LASAPTQPAPDLTPDAYIRLQLERSLALKAHDPGARSRYLIGRLAEHRPSRPPPRVLCVGCRNRHELDYLADAGFTDTIGIDLHSTDPRIRVMDMHRLEFPDCSFDVLFASHCLEHALDPAMVAAEFRRVLRRGGLIVIEVPVQYGRRGADLWDFLTPAGVAGCFEPCRVLWQEVGPQIGAERQQAARLILSPT
jgi:SAM-dependent methyltransferase